LRDGTLCWSGVSVVGDGAGGELWRSSAISFSSSTMRCVEGQAFAHQAGESDDVVVLLRLHRR
jgi:hypothetical protein